MISIIIPLYNQEDYIIETLISLNDQVNKKFEIIIINDGSTDNSLSMVNKFNSEVSIKIINQNNAGVSVARNKGLEVSSGEYVIFLDADDLLHPLTTQYIYDIINDNKYDFIGYSYKCFDIIENYDVDTIRYSEYDKDSFVKDYFMKNKIISMGGFCIKKEFVIDNKLFFSDDVSYSEDQKYIIEAILHSKKIAYISNVLHFYRKNIKSVMNRPVNIERVSTLLAMESLSRLIDNDFSEYKDFFNFYYLSMFIAVHNEIARKGAIDENQMLNEISKYNYILNQQVLSVFFKKPQYLIISNLIKLNPRYYIKLFKFFMILQSVYNEKK